MRPSRPICAIFIALGCCLPPVSAQTTVPFEFRAQQGDTIARVQNGAELALSAEAVGTTASLRITGVYQGSTTVLLPGPPEVLGSSDISVILQNVTPQTLRPGESFAIQVRYLPRSGSRVSTQIRISLFEENTTSTAPPIQRLISFTITGTAPEFRLSYFLQTDGNVIPLSSGGKLRFEPTAVNTNVQATVIISNRGTGGGRVSSITMTGTALQAIGIPLLPAEVGPGFELRFIVRYAPRQIGADAGKLRVEFANRAEEFDVEASAVGSTFIYDLLTDGGATSISPGRTLTLGEVSAGTSASFSMRVKNTGSAGGVIGVIGVSGAGFSVADLPFLPVALAPDDFVIFTLAFAPTQPGRTNGRLRVGLDTFELTATGIGVRLVYSQTVGTAVNPIIPGSAVIFSPLAVGLSARSEFSVRNAGTASANIASIGVADTRGIFKIERLPQFPLLLEPESMVTFSLVFAPNSTGVITSQLLIDSQIFALTGIGNPPEFLPDHRFTGPEGTGQASEQVGISLSLTAPYPLPLRGSLTMTVNGESFLPDPAVQFSTGGRTATFSIPANGTEAIFSNGLSVIRLQTGTVAGTIEIAPSFAAQSGLDLTPEHPQPLVISIPRSAPRLISTRVVSKDANSLTLAITGFSTTRSISRLEFQFTGAPGVRVPGSHVVLDLNSEAAVWFGSQAALAFGGQFVVSVPFTLRAESGNLASPVDSIQSVGVTAVNELGPSNSATVEIR